MDRRAAVVGERHSGAAAARVVERGGHGQRPCDLCGGDRRDPVALGVRRQTELGRGQRHRGRARASGRHAGVEGRRAGPRPLLALPAGHVRRLASPGLVRRGGGPISRGGDGRGPARAEPRRSVAVRRARARGAPVEPRRRARGDTRRGPDLTTAVAVSARSVDSLLLVVPPTPGAGARVPPDTVVAGLPLLRRIVLAGMRAGFSRVLVQSDPVGIGRLLGGTAATALSNDDVGPAPDSRRRIVILSANVVPQPRWLRALRESEIEAERLYADTSLTAVIDTADPAAVLAVAARCRGAGGLVEGVRARVDWTDLKPDDAGRFPLAPPSARRPAGAWLLRSLLQ